MVTPQLLPKLIGILDEMRGTVALAIAAGNTPRCMHFSFPSLHSRQYAVFTACCSHRRGQVFCEAPVARGENVNQIEQWLRLQS